MKKILTSTLIHVLMWVLLYEAFVLRDQWELVAMLVYCWGMAIIFAMLLIFPDESTLRERDNEGHKILEFSRILHLFTLLMCLMWNGHIVTSVAWVFAIATMFACERSAKEKAVKNAE